MKKIVVRKNRYFDSVFLMRVARRIASEPGITDAAALLATEANRKVLADMGYGDGGRDAEFAAAGSADLVVALEGEAAAVEAVAANLDAFLARGSGPSEGTTGGTDAELAPGDRARAPRTIAEAVAARPECSLAVISVPGEYAAREARNALDKGLHVFLFSSNVSAEDERALKTEATRRGLIVMGPDCGTAYLGGAGIGFANAVRRGPIGIVGSTGTGMQEFASLVHRAGSGISSGIGTGSRDLSDAIGGLSTMTAIDALEADPATTVMAILSKPPGAGARAALEKRLALCAKPVVLCLLGAGGGVQGESAASVHAASVAVTLDEAAARALRAAGVRQPPLLHTDPALLRERAAAEITKMRPEQCHVRGLFAGGTLCYQAQAIFFQSGLRVHSNAPLPGMLDLPDPEQSVADTFVDMGAEYFVTGRPHPIIDATQRRKRLEREGRDPAVAVMLLDIILGAIASRDPAGDLLEAIRAAREAARGRGGHLCVVASVCGTDEDAQGLERQKTALEEAGVLVFPTSAQAASFCREAALLLAHRDGVR